MKLTKNLPKPVPVEYTLTLTEDELACLTQLCWYTVSVPQCLEEKGMETHSVDVTRQLMRDIHNLTPKLDP